MGICRLAASKILSSQEHGGSQWITICLHLCQHIGIVKLTKDIGLPRKGRSIKLCRTRLFSHSNAGESTSSASFLKRLQETVWIRLFQERSEPKRWLQMVGRSLEF